VQDLSEAIRKSGLDPRQFEQGQIFIAKDPDVKIPDTKITGRNTHTGRPVVIITNHSINSSPCHPCVLAAPLSHDITKKRECDLEVFAATDEVEKDCLLRLGLAQPFLKVDLDGPKGKLSEDRIHQMLALFLHLLGVSMEDCETAVDLLF